MSSRAGRLALAGWALCLPCCVSDPIVDAPVLTPAGAGGSAGATSAGQSSGGASGASAGTGGGAQLGSGGVVDCSTYTDTSVSWTLTVQIKNEMSRTLYLGQETTNCEPQRLFKVEDGSRTELENVDACHTSCQAMMETGPTPCPDVCATPSTVTLQPGETIKVPWDGRYGVEQTLPQQCVHSGVAPPANCIQTKRIEADAFTFSARAGTNRQCMMPGGTCTCNPNQNGGCTSPGSLITGTIYTSEYFLKLEPGESSPGGDPPFIGISFRDSQ